MHHWIIGSLDHVPNHIISMHDMTLENSYIGDEGAIRMAEALERNRSLRELDLRRIHSPHICIQNIHSCVFTHVYVYMLVCLCGSI